MKSTEGISDVILTARIAILSGAVTKDAFWGNFGRGYTCSYKDCEITKCLFGRILKSSTGYDILKCGLYLGQRSWKKGTIFKIQVRDS